MPEAKTFTFNFKEIASALIKQSDIHEGLWGIYVEFGIGAGNIGQEPGALPGSEPGIPGLLPAAIVPIVKMGIQRFDIANSLTVDAGLVNPARKSSIKRMAAPTKKPTKPVAKSKRGLIM